jgi:hypothetical protein
VLGHRHNPLPLKAPNQGRRNRAGQKGILAERVVSPTHGDVPVEIDKGLQGHAHTRREAFPPDGDAVLFGVPGAEGRGQAHRGGLGRRGLARQHARGAIRKPKGGDTQTGNALEISCLSLVSGPRFGHAANQVHLLSQRHLVEKLVHLRFVRDRRSGIGVSCVYAAERERQGACQKEIREETDFPDCSKQSGGRYAEHCCSLLESQQSELGE